MTKQQAKKCDECNKEAVYYLGSKKNLEALICDNEECLKQVKENGGYCECEFEKELKQLNN